ncbi:hypothetical protein Q7P35_009030 [Cladosporium inversicolor]
MAQASVSDLHEVSPKRSKSLMAANAECSTKRKRSYSPTPDSSRRFEESHMSKACRTQSTSRDKYRNALHEAFVTGLRDAAEQAGLPIPTESPVTGRQLSHNPSPPRSNESLAQAATSIPTTGPSPTSPFSHRPQAITGPASAKVVDHDHFAGPPKYLIDQIITQDLIHQAVITPSGHTYDRKAIEEWIDIDGTCPITGEPLPNPNSDLIALFKTRSTDGKRCERVGDHHID